jgi:hypothetical protein
MCERDKNNPAILLWSLGNESGEMLMGGRLHSCVASAATADADAGRPMGNGPGQASQTAASSFASFECMAVLWTVLAGYGPAHLAMAAYLRARDDSRPVSGMPAWNANSGCCIPHPQCDCLAWSRPMSGKPLPSSANPFLRLISSLLSPVLPHLPHLAQIHYEGGGSRTPATDIICPMYARVHQVLKLAELPGGGTPGCVLLTACLWVGKGREIALLWLIAVHTPPCSAPLCTKLVGCLPVRLQMRRGRSFFASMHTPWETAPATCASTGRPLSPTHTCRQGLTVLGLWLGLGGLEGLGDASGHADLALR